MIHDAHRNKETQSQPQVNDTQGTQTLPERRRQEKNVNKRFQGNGEPDNDVTDDTNQIRTKDLKKGKSRHPC